MLLMIVSYLKEGSEEALIEHEAEINDRLTAANLQLVALMRGIHHCRRGYLVILETEGVADAEKWLLEGPIAKAGVFDRFEISSIEIEVGRIANG
ncbi:hypothetical protein OMW55_05295 [Sphingomonas sp. BN140010]|uniref:YCII-related domain-containing protein n=1 Tax=Sphingomonas arvum TaxID=2992113 RepID=A0ABT3JDS7_9SPHN|nr:hypothetical protein [Sphingomonas sp. BN140010]MCW3797223.1 hypothetical protein [Sphingomonas sp. BN140010]